MAATATGAVEVVLKIEAKIKIESSNFNTYKLLKTGSSFSAQLAIILLIIY